MGMFDTIIFDRPIPCPKCGAEIRSDQTKAFECTLYEYRRSQEESGGSALTTWAVYRGVLVGIETDAGAHFSVRRRGAPGQLQLREAAPLVSRHVPPARTRARRNPSRRDAHAQHRRLRGLSANGSRAATTSWCRKIGVPCCSSGIGTSSTFGSNTPSGGAASLPGRARSRGEGRRR